MTKITRTASAAAALVLLVAGSTAALAHGKHHGHGHGLHRFHHHPNFRIYLGGGEGCGFYRARWYETGRFYWKRKYYACKARW